MKPGTVQVLVFPLCYSAPRVPPNVDPALMSESENPFIDFGVDDELKEADFDFSGKILDRPESELKKNQKSGKCSVFFFRNGQVVTMLPTNNTAGASQQI